MDDGHRVCMGAEHDPSAGKFHGSCVRCGDPWPCLAERQWDRIREAFANAAKGAEDAARIREAAAEMEYANACRGRG